MHTSNKLLILSLVVLYGCQPETSAQSPAAPPPVAQVMQPAASETAAEEEKASPTVAETPEQSALIVAEIKPEKTPPVSEADAMQLAKKNNCFACHAVGKKVVGPSFKDIAAKYRGDPGAEALMMDRIANGSSGVWGVMVMPPTPKVSEADRRTLAKFVLSSK